MAKDYNSYTFKNKAVDNIQSRTNTANDPDDEKRKQRKKNRATDREDKRKRKAEIKRQSTKTMSGFKAEGTYDVDVSGERKVKKKVAKIQKKIDKVSAEKDARQKKAVKAGKRTETRKNKLLQKQVDAKRVIKGKTGSSGKNTRTKKTKDDDGARSSKSNYTRKSKTKESKSPKIPQYKPKPIRRGIQIGDGGKRRNNNAISKGKFFGINKKIR
tara:strand:- start:484 stop:1125 length:642 start_codon:yes stop_codon:yes gene_type:complete